MDWEWLADLVRNPPVMSLLTGGAAGAFKNYPELAAKTTLNGAMERKTSEYNQVVALAIGSSWWFSSTKNGGLTGKP